ncbi:MAG: 50S ribosomal protein L15 [Gemmataceae bacterium]|nr:50S ribosomal protein L15 [Gemmataceae bacterium]MCS7270191.1 50S ribosomal protein L15 [Gemmataceae bacterium]MDW8242093.1 50S ribosomal protein L15 [Thermogemmata sp.]
MDLTTVSLGVHRRKRKKRVGRGIGSGHGKTCGRGHKGQYSSAGSEWPHPLFEGGQMPLYRRLPKRGFTRGPWKKHYAIVNVGQLNAYFQAGETVNLQTLKARGLIDGTFDGLRVLGDGELDRRLTVQAHHFSATAKAKIEKAGGVCEIIPGPKKPVRNKMKPRKAKST